MQQHYRESVTEYEVKVRHGFMALKESNCAIPADGKMKNFREAPKDLSRIRQYVFDGFKRCLYSAQRFHSDPERQFAVLLENEIQPLKWFKPAEGHFKIHFSHTAPPYEPDFVVETETTKYLCEPKRADQVESDEVRAKARAAVQWCIHASAHEAEHGGKPWQYLLIPHTAITASATLDGLAAKFNVD
jgi:type III restriction enzyme